MDIELIALDANVARWGLSQTVANLRADARTVAIPILVYGPESARASVASLDRRYGRIAFVMESATTENFAEQVRPFLRNLKTPAFTPEQRARQMESAAAWFAHLADSRRTNLFKIERAEELLFQALNDPALASNALLALGAIPTVTTQERLHDVAINTNQEPPLREAASWQLAYHIQRFGLLLSAEQVSQVDAARQAAANEPPLAAALASVIGSLKPNARKVDENLQAFPLPTQPVP
jgi:hypothetical protein